MMDRLLAEEESRDCIDFAEGIERQDAKSIRVDRQAMAEWWMGDCDDEDHRLPDGSSIPRIDCGLCMNEVIEEGREGKAPWETD